LGGAAGGLLSRRGQDKRKTLEVGIQPSLLQLQLQGEHALGVTTPGPGSGREAKGADVSLKNLTDEKSRDPG